jgi:hypothetical protein
MICKIFKYLLKVFVQHVSIRATLDMEQGPMKSSILKSYGLVSRSLDKGPGWRQIKLWFSLHAIIFWKENQLVQTKKNSLTESSWFGEPKWKLRFKFVHFFKNNWLFFTVFFYSCCSNGRCIYELRTLSKAHQLPQFFDQF